MTKKSNRRFLLAAIMLLMTVFLLANGPAQQAASQECDECNAACDVIYDGCIEHGYSQTYCGNLARPCRINCFYSEACMQ